MVILTSPGKNIARRYYANIIDYGIFTAFSFVYMFLFGEQDGSGTYHVNGFMALPIPLMWILYFPLCESIFGQTVGKKVLHVYIVDLKGRGQPPTFPQAFMRRILDVIEIMFMGIPASLMINASEKNQRMGDQIAGTTVLRTDAVCKSCKTELELTPREVLNDSYTCPECKEVN